MPSSSRIAPSNTKHGTEPDPHDEAIIEGSRQRIFTGKGIGAAQNDAVSSDQRQENTENLIELETVGLHQQLGDGDRRGN